ncbi:MAG TPA: PP2C family serine/threonine-protein phosphatase [Planktothrix sp.]|jgi:serine/threonine protein phosphatase PrpC
MGCRKLNTASWTWVAAAARGTAHARMDARLQDAYKCCFIENSGSLFAIVSDGAGSAIRGGEGASLSCRTLSSLVRTHYEHNRFAPSDETIHSWIDIVRARIDEAAQSRGLKSRDFATTIVCALSYEGGSTFIHIGDGCAVYKAVNSEEWICASWPHNGEYASTTNFITDRPEPIIRITRINVQIGVLCLLTDGLERLALEISAQRPHRPFFDGLLRPVTSSKMVGRDSTLSQQLAKYLDSSPINSRTDDDKALILAVRK